MDAKKKKRLREILFKIYAALYKESEPQADFYELAENAPWCSMENGQWVIHPEAKDMTQEECLAKKWVKKIDYENYVLDSDKYDKIVNRILNRHKLSAYDRRALKIEAYLGCGPTARIKKTDEEDGRE